MIETPTARGGLCLEFRVVFVVVVWCLFDVVVSLFCRGVRLGRVGALPIHCDSDAAGWVVPGVSRCSS